MQFPNLSSLDFDWETLVTGFLAVGAAFFAIRQTGANERKRLKREANAARATLPLVLSGIVDWATAIGKELMELAGCVGPDEVIDSKAIQAFTRPETPSKLVEELKAMIRATDDEAIVERISKMLAKMQVLAARTDGMNDPSLIVLEEEVISHVIDAATIYAQAESLFDFGRRKSVTTPRTLGWDNLFSGLNTFGNYRYAYDLAKKKIIEMGDAGIDPEA